MKKISHTFDYTTILRYSALLLVFICFNRLEKQVMPYSTAIFVSSIVTNSSLIATPFLYVFSFVCTGNFGLLPSVAISATFIIIVKLIYLKCKAKIGYEYVIFCAISMIGFIILGDTSNSLSYEKRISVTLICCFLTFLGVICTKAVSEKGLKNKMSYDEIISVTVIVVCFGLGISNLFVPHVWKSISVFFILISCYLLRFGLGSFISAILGISLSLYYGNIEYVAIFLTLGISSEIFMSLSKYVSALALVLCDYFIQILFNVYGGYTLYEFLPVLIGASAFCVLPNKPLKKVKEKLYSFREKQLVRQTINRNRLMLSNRLYELSGVFTEMSYAFLRFGKSQLDEGKTKTTFEKEIKENICKNCNNYIKCKKYEKEIFNGVNKMIDIGFAKGKLSLIDLPKEIGDHCLRPTEIIYGLNRMLAEYRSYILENENVVNSRALLSAEADGVSEILKDLALESGALLKYQSRLERLLSETLTKKGFTVSELLIYGEQDRTTVSLILSMKEFSLAELEKTITGVVGEKMALSEKNNVTEDKFHLSFTKAPAYDAVFGIASAKKDGSEMSGDTHSVTRINSQKFLVAVSDGMGSGIDAQNVSSVSLSLIESFYKAGMDSNLILNTVNKLLSINTEDSFTALDVSVIDLKNCCADFIKYGAPYGFIINDGSVKIVESNSLPLGILNDLKPSVCHTELNDGDVILLTSDGISDAFGGSSEIIDFLRKIPALNPQTLSDRVLEKAVTLSNGKHKDDMTALSVRVFKKTESA